jgi:aconitate hydratase
VRAVIAESFERIHRSNLIGMGVIPLQFPAGETPEPRARRHRGRGDHRDRRPQRRIDPKTVRVVATPSEPVAGRQGAVEFDAVVRIDTPGEADYYRNGGILQYVLRSLV